MSTKFEGRSLHHDLIDDIVESPSTSLSLYPIKPIANRTYSAYSTLPTSLHKTKNSSLTMTNEHRDRLHLTLPRSNSSLILMNNDERRKEIDLILKHLYDGKLITTMNDDYSPPDNSESLTIIKNEKENLDFFSIDGDLTSLQRELQEKELDIIHLRKEIQELQLENKLLKSKVPTIYSNNNNNNSEIEIIRREKDILQNELHNSQELISKIQQQKDISIHSNKINEMNLYQKEFFEKKIHFIKQTYDQQMKIIINENEKLKENFYQFEKFLKQLKHENEELQYKLTEAKKRNDELFYQEFNTLRNDLKLLKQRNNELFEENIRLQQKLPYDSKHLRIERSISPNISETSDSTNYLTTINLEHYNTRTSNSINRSIILNENNHQQQHHTIKYNSLNNGQDEINRNKLKSIDQQYHFHSTKTKRTPSIGWNEDNTQTHEESVKYALVPYIGMTNYDNDHQAIDDTKPLSSHLSQSNYSIHRSTISNESQHHSRQIINNHHNDHRQNRRTIETVSPRRPYAPSSINDIHLNDIIKFSRPGGKISRGIVKYIGPLPDKTDQYLGLELENEESKHDGIYQDQRLFQCKPNKGVFVAFNKVIMAWSET